MLLPIILVVHMYGYPKLRMEVAERFETERECVIAGEEILRFTTFAKF